MLLGHNLQDRIFGHEQDRVAQLLQVVLCSFFIALCARIRIPLPFTPVPITLQTFAVLLLGSFLGSKNGTLAVLIYLSEVMLGLPVLQGGRCNPLALIGPTGGYLFGYLIIAFLVGWVLERQSQFRYGVAVLAGVCACFIDLAIGSLWLSRFVGMQNMLMMGAIPFIPGEVLKSMFVAAIFQQYHRILNRTRERL
jgi:biotin transport system substrate-specific component